MSAVRLRYIIRPREVTNRTDLQVLSVYRDHGVVPKDSRSDNFNKTPDDITRYQEVRIGDLAINKMKAWQGSLGVSSYHGIVSPDYLVCSIDPSVNYRFFHYLMRSSSLAVQFRIRSKGIRPGQWRIYWEDLADIRVTLPSADEQRRIANFLDAEAYRVGKLITAITKQSNLLHCKRRSLLMAALDKDGCVSTRVGYYLELVTSGPRGWSNYVSSHGTPFFRSANISRDEIAPNLKELALVDLPQSATAEAMRSRIRVGDVLVGITGANTGWVSLADERIARANVSQHVCLVRPGKEIDGRWLAYALSAPQIQEQLLGSQYGGTKTQLSLSNIRTLTLPLPPLDIQQTTSTAIGEQLATITTARALRNRQVVILIERQQALITSVITGQIDVATAAGVLA